MPASRHTGKAIAQKDKPEHDRKPILAPVDAPTEPEQEMKQAHVSSS